MFDQGDDNQSTAAAPAAPAQGLASVGSNLPTPVTAQSSDDTKAPSSSGSSDLSQIKKEALASLAPLADKLDQVPAEKFKTLMMLIQSADSQDLIPAAYEAAKQITDDKAKAQALLDVINEINYFSQPK